MTRQFNAMYHCNNCKTWQTQETMFGRWIRNNPALESRSGYVVSDIDYTIHKYKTQYGREFQLMMFVEVKTNGSPVSESQRDTLHAVNQLTRNRRSTPTKSLKYQAQGAQTDVEIYSHSSQKNIKVRMYGFHVLQFSGLGPDDSEKITWDKKQITLEQLTSILRFDLDPDTLGVIDLRSHHSANQSMAPLFDCIDGIAA